MIPNRATHHIRYIIDGIIGTCQISLNRVDVRKTHDLLMYHESLLKQSQAWHCVYQLSLLQNFIQKFKSCLWCLRVSLVNHFIITLYPLHQQLPKGYQIYCKQTQFLKSYFGFSMMTSSVLLILISSHVTAFLGLSYVHIL